jgi:hypothetical protein
VRKLDFITCTSGKIKKIKKIGNREKKKKSERAWLGCGPTKH